MVLETHMKLQVTELSFFWEKVLPQKSGKLTKSGPKTGFLNLLKNVVINFY